MLLDQVKLTIQEFNLLEPGEKVVVGVSGGADSVALLQLLDKLKKPWRLKLHIAHLNHLLRPGEAERDSNFVAGLAKKMKLPITCAAIDVKDFAKSAKLSIEEAARNLRYDFLVNLAKENGCKKIALGHNRNDQAETVLMRFLRGSGVAGLGGIPVKRAFDGCLIVRPLINTTRKQITDFLAAKKINYRTDSSNLSNLFLRNKVRQQLIPLIEQGFNANIQEVLVNFAENISVDFAFLEETVQRKFKLVSLTPNQEEVVLNSKKFSALHKALQKSICRLAIKQLKGNVRKIDFRHWKELESLIEFRPHNSIVDLPGNVSVAKKKGKLVFYSRNSTKALVNTENIC
ncbi:tRNA lysidine(34) synthetase TilS [Candidatus Omnitrophota bacterium]